MSTDTVLEERVAVLEQEVSALKQQLQRVQIGPDWLVRVSGSLKHDRDFEEVLRLGRAVRESDRPSEQP